MFVVHEIVTWVHYEDDDTPIPNKNFDRVIDADVDIDVLRDWVNAYYADPIIVNHYRQNVHCIPADKLHSPTLFSEGGGVMVYRHLEIRTLDPLFLPSQQKS